MEPAHCAFSALGESVESFVIKNPFVVANTNLGAVYKTDAGTFSEADNVQEKHHRDKYLVFNGYETTVRQLFGKLRPKMLADIKQIKAFEVFKSSKRVNHQDGDDFTVGDLRFAVT